MASGLVSRSRQTLSCKTVPSDKLLTERLPDVGPLSIKDYENFKKGSKAIFNEKWGTAVTSPQKNEISLAEFVRLQDIGIGSFGIVVLVKHEPTKHLYALKCIDKDEVIKKCQVDNLMTEKLILKCINHPLTIYLKNSFKDNNYIYFVLPFVEGGDLYGHLKEIGQGHEDRAKFYASQVILALEYLHYLDFIYRDLKPENILIDRTGYLKLADFGFSKRLKRRLRTYTLCGTPEYLAPEIILNKGYGKAVDWWAAGCLIFELVAGSTPFVSNDSTRIYEKAISRNFKCPKTFSPELKDLVENLLQTDLSRRYGNLKNGVSDIKCHRWFVHTNWMAILNRKVEPPYKPKSRSLDLEKTCSWRMPKQSDQNKYSNDFIDF